MSLAQAAAAPAQLLSQAAQSSAAALAANFNIGAAYTVVDVVGEGAYGVVW
jgi:hypothetical protein